MPRLFFLIAALLGLLQASPAAARQGMAGQPVAVCFAPADRTLDARTLLASPARFDCRTPQLDAGAGDFDLLSAPLAAGAGKHWPLHVRVASDWWQRVTVHARYADGHIATRSFDPTTISRHLELGAVVQVKLPVRGVAVERLLWRAEGAPNLRGILLGASVATPSQAAESNLFLGAIYAAFAGLCLALLVYNMALWCVLRHHFQLAYAVMVVMLLGYALSSSGALAWLFPDMLNTDRQRINYVLLAGSGLAALGFARTFFERQVFAGWLGRVAVAVAALLAGATLVFALTAPFAIRWTDRLYSYAFLALLLFVVPMLGRAWVLRSRYLWVFVLAWTAPVVLSGFRTANNLGLVGWSFWLDNSTLLAMVAEATLSSLAVAYRIHLLAHERDEARVREVAARHLADTDPLTGLLNRRAFMTRAIGQDTPQTLLLIDLDHFKQVNDTLGHDGGDEVLAAVAGALADAAPDALVARFGGEEFAIVAPVGAAPPARDVLDALRRVPLPFDIVVTASIGTCTGPLAREADWKLLYRRADEALFAAKAAGRDRVRDAQPIALAA